MTNRIAFNSILVSRFFIQSSKSLKTEFESDNLKNQR